MYLIRLSGLLAVAIQALVRSLVIPHCMGEHYICLHWCSLWSVTIISVWSYKICCMRWISIAQYDNRRRCVSDRLYRMLQFNRMIQSYITPLVHYKCNVAGTDDSIIKIRRSWKLVIFGMESRYLWHVTFILRRQLALLHVILYRRLIYRRDWTKIYVREYTSMYIPEPFACYAVHIWFKRPEWITKMQCYQYYFILLPWSV